MPSPPSRAARSVSSALIPALFALTVGCGLSAQPAPAKSAAAQTSAATVPAKPSKLAAGAPLRRVGDFFVHRFSGSFARDPLTLTEEVVAEEEQAWVVDFALSQNEQVERLRVRFDRQTGEPLSAARLAGTTEAAAKLADYEALMARTVYAADVNDGLVSELEQTCLVGSDELDCETKTYKVWVGDAQATLQVVHSDAYADRDVSGEITTDDGKLIYRAELVEAKQGKSSVGVALR